MRRIWPIALMPILLALPCQATVIRVDVNGGGDYLTIGEGVAAAGERDTVLVAPGTYAGPLNRGITVEGVGTYLVSEDGPATTIVDGEYQGRVFTVKRDAIVEGFTVTHGEYDSSGSAFRCEAGSAVLDCIITENSGTAMECYGPDSSDWIIIGSCQFLRNGTGIRSFGPLWVVDCSFVENDGNGISSGIESPYGSMCNVNRSTFHGNGGCGVSSWEEGGRIFRSVFTENAGGAIRIGQGWTDVSYCTIVHNYSSTQAAIAASGHHHGGSPTISNSIVAFNSCVGAVQGGPSITHNIVFGNAGGDSLPGNHFNNLFADPLLCDVYAGNVAPCADSPAINWGAGAYEEAGCGPCQTPVEQASWGTIKALFR